MNRVEFMKKLEQLLSDISENERKEALQYYEDYFEDAGKENEEVVIKELGSPERIARIIKQDIKGNRQEGEFTERGYEESKEAAYEMSNPNQTEKPKKKKMDKNQILLIVILCILAAPFIVTIGGGVFGVVVGAVAAVFGIAIGISAVSVSLVIAGIAMVIAGIVNMFVTPAVGCLLCGVGLLIFAGGVLLTNLMLFLWGVCLPKLITGIVKMIRRMFQRGEAAA